MNTDRSSNGGGELSFYRNLKDRDLAIEGIAIGEGRYVVERMLASTLIRMISVLCTPSLGPRLDELALGRCPVIRAPEEEISGIAGFAFHRGVFGAAHRPAGIALEAFLGSSPSASRVVVCSRVRELENIGSIIRTSRAFGFDALVTGPGSCDPFNRKAVRVSMGGCFYIPIISSEFEEAAASLRKAGFHIVAATPDKKAIPAGSLFSRGGGLDTVQKIAIVLGDEDRGLEPSQRGMCDVEARIPIDPEADSLNIGVACGIFLSYAGKYK